jgi:hypothetical protein
MRATQHDPKPPRAAGVHTPEPDTAPIAMKDKHRAKASTSLHQERPPNDQSRVRNIVKKIEERRPKDVTKAFKLLPGWYHETSGLNPTAFREDLCKVHGVNSKLGTSEQCRTCLAFLRKTYWTLSEDFNSYSAEQKKIIKSLFPWLPESATEEQLTMALLVDHYLVTALLKDQDNDNARSKGDQPAAPPARDEEQPSSSAGGRHCDDATTTSSSTSSSSKEPPRPTVPATTTATASPAAVGDQRGTDTMGGKGKGDKGSKGSGRGDTPRTDVARRCGATWPW